VPTGRLTPEALVALLERFPLEDAIGKPRPEATDAHLQLLLARIGALTDAIRASGADDSARLAWRLMLNDLAACAAQFRARTNDLRPAVAQALEELRDAVGRCDAVLRSGSA
jgi:hypothetical protein